jgi:hypothetical protein
MLLPLLLLLVVVLLLLQMARCCRSALRTPTSASTRWALR